MPISSNLYIGPAGWSYPDWKGIVYPAKRSSKFSELHYLADYFNTVEINSTFYKIPSLNSVESWLQQVQDRPHFMFSVKSWQRFTHTTLPLNESELDTFSQVLTPMQTEKKLGVLLLQFPWRFKRHKETVQRLHQLLRRFKAFPCAVEFRHASWQHEEIYRLLRDHHTTFVNIDQPVIGESVEPSAIHTASTSYVRFHGRNYDNWFREDAGQEARYDYLYSPAELESWLVKVENLRQTSESVYVIFNNHFRGQAVINAFQFLYLITKQKSLAPPTLLNMAPQLANYVDPDDYGQTMELF